MTAATIRLTQEERDILELFADGDHPREIAHKLVLERPRTLATVQRYCNHDRGVARQLVHEHDYAATAAAPVQPEPAPEPEPQPQPAGEVLSTDEQWWCLTCGGRYCKPYPIHGVTCEADLVPVLVTATLREARP